MAPGGGLALLGFLYTFRKPGEALQSDSDRRGDHPEIPDREQ